MSYDGIPINTMYDDRVRGLKREVSRINAKIEVLCMLLAIDGVGFDDIEDMRNRLEIERGRIVSELNTI